MTRFAVDRPLTDAERDLLLYLGVLTITSQYPCTTETAADALDTFAARPVGAPRGRP